MQFLAMHLTIYSKDLHSWGQPLQSESFSVTMKIIPVHQYKTKYPDKCIVKNVTNVTTIVD